MNATRSRVGEKEGERGEEERDESGGWMREWTGGKEKNQEGWDGGRGAIRKGKEGGGVRRLSEREKSHFIHKVWL